MSIDYYITEASDWQASCVGSASLFAGKGGGIWAIQLLSPTVCPKPVLFTFIGAGAGFGAGVSAAESSISTNRESDSLKTPLPHAGKQPGFSKLECEKPFSLRQLDRSSGRLSVLEGYLFGYGGGCVIISAFDRSGVYFNSQNIWGPALSATRKRKSGGIATTIGLWKSEFMNLVPVRSSSRQSSSQDCSIYDLPLESRTHSLQNYAFPKTVPGPIISSGR